MQPGVAGDYPVTERNRGVLLRISAFAICFYAEAAAAQLSAPPIVSALPGVSQISLANAAGVLKYCERMQLVSVVSADAVIGQLPSKPDVTSADYIAGESGQILGDGGKNLSLARAPGYLQSQGCNMVLDRAKSFEPAR